MLYVNKLWGCCGKTSTGEKLQKGLKIILYLKMKLSLQKFHFWDSAIILLSEEKVSADKWNRNHNRFFTHSAKHLFLKIPISILFNKQVMNWVFRAWKKDTGNLRIMPNWFVKTFTRNCDLIDSREISEQLYWLNRHQPSGNQSLTPELCSDTKPEFSSCNPHPSANITGAFTSHEDTKMVFLIKVKHL